MLHRAGWRRLLKHEVGRGVFSSFDDDPGACGVEVPDATHDQFVDVSVGLVSRGSAGSRCPRRSRRVVARGSGSRPGRRSNTSEHSEPNCNGPRKKLRLLNTASELNSLRVPPGNRLENLVGDCEIRDAPSAGAPASSDIADGLLEGLARTLTLVIRLSLPWRNPRNSPEQLPVRGTASRTLRGAIWPA